MKADPTPHWIAGGAVGSGGPEIQSINPSTGEVDYAFAEAENEQVDLAVDTARERFPLWRRTSLQERSKLLEMYALLVRERGNEIAGIISAEVGKPRWEALTEVNAIAGKVALSIDAYAQRCAQFSKGGAMTRFKPHGVVAVFGPFNFPGHLANGHFVPALLAGNTVVLKPSEQAPRTCRRLEELLHEAGLPPGVMNLVQGGRSTAELLAQHPGIDGLFFTGSARVGVALGECYASTPGKILALEMGGNNPLVVWDVDDIDAAVIGIIQSAFLTAGQRCTCSRRLIVSDDRAGRELLDALAYRVKRLQVGPPDLDPEPFMGPVISEQAALLLFEAQQELVQAGGEVLLGLQHLKPGTGLVSPAIIDVTNAQRRDREIFGPLLQVIRVGSFTEAIAEANNTAYGLAAGIFTIRRDLYERFFEEVRAGIVNWNHQLTGASGAAPFGGVGLSGNHRPSGYFAADYCSYPVASMENEQLASPDKLPPGMT